MPARRDAHALRLSSLAKRLPGGMSLQGRLDRGKGIRGMTDPFTAGHRHAAREAEKAAENNRKIAQSDRATEKVKQMAATAAATAKANAPYVPQPSPWSTTK